MSDLQIVQINVSQTVGAIPSGLQQTGALVSVGATPLDPGGLQLLTQLSDLEALVNMTVKSLLVASNKLTITLTDVLPSSYAVGSTADMVLTGVQPAGYNGTYTMTVKSSTSLETPFTQTLAPATTMGAIQLPHAAELLAMGSTFFAQGEGLSVYVLELGPAADVKTSVAALSAYIDEPTRRFYTYLVPQTWDGVAEFIALTKNHTANTSMLYFFVTTTAGPVNLYDGIKSVVTMVQDAAAPATECSVASLMWNYLSASPSPINKVPPMAFRYLLGVTTYTGGSAAKAQLTENKINYVGTGAEGGISNTLVMKGVTCDGNDMTYWYSVDWVQINVHQALANAVINGSNNPINPLYYNQDGVDRLQVVAQRVFNTGVEYGLVNGQTPVNAIAFKDYVKTNPNDYAIGRYAGLSAPYTPMRGFTKIIFNINVTLQLS
ncbi:hypothetical protein [Serratia fonticola]|uniref:hypothetical protein n=1 Tax=Serratia fonticola TaxID=47917 RepID=UPI00301D3AD0